MGAPDPSQPRGSNFVTSLSGPRRAPSVADVARAAGVSMQTVSRVSNGLNNVQADTKRRVEEAMDLLGYRPNWAARSLRSGRFNTIGVITFTLSSFGNMRTIESIAAAAAAADYAITLMSAAHRTQSDVVMAFARLRQQAVDGVIAVIESHILDEADLTFPEGLPVVIVDSANRPDRSLVDTDQAQGARLATEHLLSLGHETVWHISGPSGSFSSERRKQAWRETLLAANRTVPEPLQGDWTADSGYELGKEIARNGDVTAVFASNDQMALGLLRACHEIGRPVPRSLSVVGFDDMQESDQFWPPLTTVHQHFDEVGRASIRSLMSAIDGDHTPVQVVVPTRLVVRESTAAPTRPTGAAQ